MTCSQVNSEHHLDVILETEEVIRLNQEISCLRAEIEKGDRQIKELEEQVTEPVVSIIAQVTPSNHTYTGCPPKSWVITNYLVVMSRMHKHLRQG